MGVVTGQRGVQVIWWQIPGHVTVGDNADTSDDMRAAGGGEFVDRLRNWVKS